MLLQQQALLETGHSKPPGSQQTSPPQQSHNGPGTPVVATPGTPLASADDEMLWSAATRSWSRQMVSLCEKLW